MGQYLECGNTVFSDLYVDLTFCSIRVFYYLYLFVGHILTPYLTNFIRSSANTFPNGESFHGQIKFQTLTYTNYHSDEFTILDIKRKWRQDSNLFLPSPLPLPLPLCSCYSTYFLLFFPFLPFSKWMWSWVQDIATFCNDTKYSKERRTMCKLRHALKIQICTVTMGSSRSSASRNADFGRRGSIIEDPPPHPTPQTRVRTFVVMLINAQHVDYQWPRRYYPWSVHINTS